MAYTPKLGVSAPVNYAEMQANAHASNLEAQQLGAAGLMEAGDATLRAGNSPPATSTTATGVPGSWTPGAGGYNYVWITDRTTKQTGILNPVPSAQGYKDYLPFPQQNLGYPSSCDHSLNDNAVYLAAFGL